MEGFELWEICHDKLKESYKEVTCLDMFDMEHPFLGRKWVHESVLLDVGQSKVPCHNLMDKKGGSALNLGKPGERRFAPRVAKAGEMKQIVPADIGDVWCRVRVNEGEWDPDSYVDTFRKPRSPSFVFQREETVVRRAYEILHTHSLGDDSDCSSSSSGSADE